jgi:myo-inositol 2-dehydrogenase/D-chiro-inositol 1-dehydrogenase
MLDGSSPGEGENPMKNELRFGLIGAGRIGPVHAETLAFRVPQARLAAIADLKQPAAQAVASRCNIPKVVSSGAEIIADPAIDAVAICSPTDTHADLIVAAARAGKHIFCEKPISLSLKEIDRALAAVASAGVKLQVGFNRRFDSNFLRVRQAVESGEIGTPNLFHIVSRDPFPPPLAYLRPSGGIFLDMMVHDFDMARFLMGDEVEEVFAAGAVMVDPGFAGENDFDTAVVLLRFRGGAIGTIDNSRKSTFGYDQRVEILGSKGKIASENRYPEPGHRQRRESGLLRSSLQFFYAAVYRQLHGGNPGFHRSRARGQAHSGHRRRQPDPGGHGAGRRQVERRTPPGSHQRGFWIRPRTAQRRACAVAHAPLSNASACPIIYRLREDG